MEICTAAREFFVRQTQFFAGTLDVPARGMPSFKKNWGSMAEKNPLLGRINIFQTSPRIGNIYGWDPTVQQAKSIRRNLNMWDMLWPLLLIIGSNCFYNICTKSIPENINTFGALTATYLVGAALSAILFISGVGPARAAAEIQKVSWTPFILGLSIVGLEAGYVFLYRAGWKISSGSLTANICLAVALLLIGFLLYKETISPRQLLGVVVCGIGLFLINR